MLLRRVDYNTYYVANKWRQLVLCTRTLQQTASITKYHKMYILPQLKILLKINAIRCFKHQIITVFETFKTTHFQ